MKKSYNIVSVEAKDLFGAMLRDGRLGTDGGYTVLNSATGELNLGKFTNTLDWSLDTLQLEKLWGEVGDGSEFGFVASGGRHKYTTNVICVTFKYSYKEFNLAGKNTYIRSGYAYRDCFFTDGVCLAEDGTLIGIQTNVAVESPLSQEVLGKWFFYNGECYEKQARPMPTLMDKAGLRNYLYTNGFRCNGVDYVRYKRSCGSSRVGKCLFINKALADGMTEWDKCGLDAKPNEPIDLAAWEAYISLPMSSIIDTVDLDPAGILVIDDVTSKFDDEAVAVWIENGTLASATRPVTIENNLFDGQSLMDASVFEEAGYRNKGMLLLRNRFFKSCCFNTNLSKWFSDHGITSVAQLNGFTLATDISQIKLVTTPSSIKYSKFGPIEQWLKTVGKTFGIVKHEKKTHYFDGRMVQTHYQLINTLDLTYDEVEELLKPSLDFISAIRNDPAVLRYAIKYPFNDGDDDPWGPLDTKNKIVFKLLGINDKFACTKMYRDFRDDLVRSKLRDLRRGHILVNGNYSTIMGNGAEMLLASIGRFDGESRAPGELEPGQIHSTRFDYDKKLLCSRSPHVCAGNVLLVTNVASEMYDTYFNLTPEIVCVTAINDNIQQRLNGCDYDSDTILITDHPLLVEAAERHYSEFKVPTNATDSFKRKRKYCDEDKADLDVKTSVNKIGEIINLSQQLNSLLWERVHRGASIEDCRELYEDICKLAVLSNVEIDRAKREFTINSTTELNALKTKYKITEDSKCVKPQFFKMITTENGYELSNNIRYRYFDTPMDYLQKALSKFKYHAGRQERAKGAKQIRFMDIVKKPDGSSTSQGYYYSRKAQIIDKLREANEEKKKLFAKYAPGDPKEGLWEGLLAIRETCISEIESLLVLGSNGRVSEPIMYLTLKELDNESNAAEARFVFDMLFSGANEYFFDMIVASKECIDTLCETPDEGDIEFFGYRFSKIPLRASRSEPVCENE